MLRKFFLCSNADKSCGSNGRSYGLRVTANTFFSTVYNVTNCNRGVVSVDHENFYEKINFILTDTTFAPLWSRAFVAYNDALSIVTLYSFLEANEQE